MNKETEINYVCATPISVTKNGKIKILESTIVRPERNLIIVKKQKQEEN